MTNQAAPFVPSNAPEEFHGTRWDKRLYCGMYVVYALLLLPFVFVPGKGGVGLSIAVALLIVVMLAASWRGRRYGTVLADASGLIAFGPLRRRHWDWSDIQYFDVGRSSLAFAPASNRVCLRVHQNNGETVVLRAITARPGRLDAGWLEVATAALNNRLTESHT